MLIAPKLKRDAFIGYETHNVQAKLLSRINRHTLSIQVLGLSTESSGYMQVNLVFRNTPDLLFLTFIICCV